MEGPLRELTKKGVVARIKQLKGGVAYDWEYPAKPGARKLLAGPPGPVWMKQKLGDEYFQEVTRVTLPFEKLSSHACRRGRSGTASSSPWRKTTLTCLDDLSHLESLLLLTNYPLTSPALDRLERLDRLKELNIWDDLNADQLIRVARLTNLESLSLRLGNNPKINWERPRTHVSVEEALSREGLSDRREHGEDRAVAKPRRH